GDGHHQGPARSYCGAYVQSEPRAGRCTQTPVPLPLDRLSIVRERDEYCCCPSSRHRTAIGRSSSTLCAASAKTESQQGPRSGRDARLGPGRNFSRKRPFGSWLDRRDAGLSLESDGRYCQDQGCGNQEAAGRERLRYGTVCGYNRCLLPVCALEWYSCRPKTKCGCAPGCQDGRHQGPDKFDGG